MQLAFILSFSHSLYFFSHHHLLILQISIVYKLYVIHEQYTSVVSVWRITPNSTTILPKSYSNPKLYELRIFPIG